MSQYELIIVYYSKEENEEKENLFCVIIIWVLAVLMA